MWSPTHTQVTVLRAKQLLTKGKNNTNNCFVIISLGKEKYQTSVKEKSGPEVDWLEECELTIPNKGNRAEIVLTCLHKNNLGLDEFLGQVTLPLNEMDAYETPRSKWYELQSKPGKEKKKERGKLEVRVQFTVKAGSLTDLSKKEKHKSSIGQIASNVGGSLLSLGTLEKRKGLKKFAKSMGSKMHISGKSKKEKDKSSTNDDDSISGSYSNIGSFGLSPKYSRQTAEDADPGVISENEDEFAFDNLSHKSSGNSINIKGSSTIFNPAGSQFSTLEEEAPSSLNSIPPPKPIRNNNTTTNNNSSSNINTNNSNNKLDEWEAKLYGKHLEIGSSDSLKRRSWENNRVPLNTTNDDNGSDQFSTNLTAPNTPTLKEKNESPTINEMKEIKESIEKEVQAKPKTLPRSQTLESMDKEIIIQNNKDIKNDKLEKENLFSKKLKYFRKEKSVDEKEKMISFKGHIGERIIIGHENGISKNNGHNVEISKEALKKYEGKSREEMIKIACNLENEVRIEKSKTKELEDYLDNLLLRVMETHPRILQNPYDRKGENKSG